MQIGELRSQVDRIWNGFWTGGIVNPLEVIGQIMCVLFIRPLDNLQSSPPVTSETDIECTVTPTRWPLR